jgi:hypothetical protein
MTHFSFQILVYILSFTIKRQTTAGETCGVPLCDVAGLVTFPLDSLLNQFEPSGMGPAAFILNSVLWAGFFYCFLVVLGKIRSGSKEVDPSSYRES